MEKKFDIDKFIQELDELTGDSTEEMYEQERYRDCPRCGSSAWDNLVYSTTSRSRGRVIACSDCEHDHEQ